MRATAVISPCANLDCSSGRFSEQRSRSRGLSLTAPDNGDIAEVLNFGAGEFEPEKLSAASMKFSRTLKHIYGKLQ